MIPTRINGRWTLLLPEHRAARSQWETGWERERWDAIHDDITDGTIVYDVGAEEGDLSALMASWGARLVLFEPNARVWPNIRAIFDANALTERVLGCWVGFAGDTNRTGDGIIQTTVGAWPACADGPIIDDHGFCQLNERPDLPACTLDAYARATGINPALITLDVEGSEYAVLLGARYLLEHARPIVYASIHPAFMRDQYGHDPDQLAAYMRQRGYAGTLLATDHEEHWCWRPI